MIIDCIMFAYEPDALEIRLAELSDVVDLTVIVEGDRTFRGEKRKLARPDAPRTVSEVVELPPDSVDAWDREKIQRDATVELARKYAQPGDFVIVADADEIPHPQAVANARGPETLSVDYREWYANWRAPDEWQPHNQPFIAPIELVDSAHDIRARRPYAYSSFRGWHLSTLGDASLASRKIGEFAHSEYDLPIWRDEARLASTRDRGIDLLERFTLQHTTDVPSVMYKFPQFLGRSL